MGYFSQRKKHARQKMFMLISLMILALYNFLLLFDSGTEEFFKDLRNIQFHAYLYTLFIVLYTIFHRQIAYTLCAILLVFWNYGSLAQSARIFFNQEPAGFNQLDISYKKGEQTYLPLKEEKNIEHKGKLKLSPHLSAAFIDIKQQDKLITLISLDFSKKYEQEFPIAFQNLEKFVLMQNNPVILVGDFGIPSWNILFKTFLNKTSLSVKNRILFTDGKETFSFWFVPSINVLGFDNVGIKKISMQEKQFNIKLGY